MTSMEVSESPSITLDQNNNNNAKKNSKNYEKYSLRPRSIQKRIETEKRAKEPKKTPKPKLKPPKLSKYRRKTANARERTRMKEINYAFDSLQRVVPQYPILPVDSHGKTCEKLTKITTLRLAMKYISTLNQLLTDAGGTSSCSENLSTLPNHPISQFHLLEDESLSPAGSSMAGSSSSEFSPSPSSSCSFTLSPCPVTGTVPQHISIPISTTPTPNCIQTVMRSVVLPSLSQNRNAKTFFETTTNLNEKNVVKKNMIYSGQTYSNNPSNLISVSSLSYLPSTSSPFLMSSQSSSTSSMLKLPTPVKLNHLINQSVSSLLIGECSGGGNRTGSLSSLTESDLSEYASDLLSDEGSGLDDPMFNDIIVDSEVGGTVEDLDHLLLESDGDSLHFSSDLSDS